MSVELIVNGKRIPVDHGVFTCKQCSHGPCYWIGPPPDPSCPRNSPSSPQELVFFSETVKFKTSEEAHTYLYGPARWKEA